MSGVRLTRHYLPGMRRKDWGRIVFVSSESGVQIPAEMIHYGMTKTAQLAIARGVAESVAGTGITVNSVLPGPTESEGVATVRGRPGEAAGRGPLGGRGRVLPDRPAEFAARSGSPRWRRWRT